MPGIGVSCQRTMENKGNRRLGTTASFIQPCDERTRTSEASVVQSTAVQEMAESECSKDEARDHVCSLLGLADGRKCSSHLLHGVCNVDLWSTRQVQAGRRSFRFSREDGMCRIGTLSAVCSPPDAVRIMKVPRFRSLRPAHWQRNPSRRY